MMVYIFYGYLVRFAVFCYFLFTFGIVCGNLVYFSYFGTLYQEKSGNPGAIADVNLYRQRSQKSSCACCWAGLPDFSWNIIPKPEKMYRMNSKCTKWPLNIPNVFTVFQMAIKYPKCLYSIPNGH
jgi:hypothetical protein